MKRLFVWALFALVAFAAFDGGAAGREEILSFKSHIVVDPDGALTVTEIIRVRATGNQIKRGIYRDLPTSMKDADGNTARMAYQVQRVLRDGAGIATFETSEGGGRRIYFGSKDIYIDPGVYTYEFTYRALGQVRFFQDFDEVYWNATGDKWAFPILKAEATVRLPSGASPKQYTAYTGRYGQSGAAYRADVAPSGDVSFITTRTLNPGEGMTIAVGWPKGFVSAPTLDQQAPYFVRAYLPVIAGVIGLLLILAYYLWAWNRVGRDPDGGPVVPLFAPPEGYSPAMTRVLMKMGFDNKAFAAAIVSLAVKGALRIEEDGGTFTLVRQPFAQSAALSKGERGILNGLLRRGSIELKQSNHTRIGGSLDVFKSHLQDELENTHFTTNKFYLIPGAVLSLVTVVAMAAVSPSQEALPVTLFMTVWLSGWSVGCFFLLKRVYTAWRSGALGRAGALALFTVPFIGGEFAGLSALVAVTSLFHAVFLAGAAGLLALFFYLLKAPTLHGRRVMDQVEGFKMFLEVAEKDRLAMFHPPDLTPEEFQAFLPYAMALDVEQAWGERFADLLKAAGRDPNEQPGWYHGHGWGHGFADHLGGGLHSAVTSSSTAPPSSSGSGGGGFSGGGGGGGGGGGF